MSPPRLFVATTATAAALMVLVAACCASFAAAASGPHHVTSLPGWSHALNDDMYTGYLDTNDGYNSQLFYWLSMARNMATPASDTPLVLWLQGGPGCSGGIGWFLENGPYNLQADRTLTLNPYSWNQNAHFFFLDQPIGTGLSPLSAQGTNATYCTTLEQSTAQLYTVLRGFFDAFPALLANPFYITGESYGGKFIPYLATMILDHQAEKKINLRAIAIGDGWVDPLTQTAAYGAQAYNLGLIDENELANVNAQMDTCTRQVNAQQWAEAQVTCDGLLDYIVFTAAGNINVDDVREWGNDEHMDWLEAYLSTPAVWDALHLVNPPAAYSSCDATVGHFFATDEMKPSAGLLPRLVESLQQVYLYEGSFDLNCGVVGVEKYLAKLFPDSYMSAKRYIWTGPGDSHPSGYVKPILPSLTFIVVQDAGHMVPTTQPKSSLDMLTHLLTNTPFTPSNSTTPAAATPAHHPHPRPRHGLRHSLLRRLPKRHASLK